MSRLPCLSQSGDGQGWRERVPDLCQQMPDCSMLRNEHGQPDIAAARNARQWQLVPTQAMSVVNTHCRPSDTS